MTSSLYHVTVSVDAHAISIKRVCGACGITAEAEAGTPYIREGEVWFCEDCWRGLPRERVAAVVREVALRGVPLS